MHSHFEDEIDESYYKEESPVWKWSLMLLAATIIGFFGAHVVFYLATTL